MDYLNQVVYHTWAIWVEAAPWLIFGLLAAGLLKVWFPAHLLQKWLGGRGIGACFKAAVIGTPFPLCSCSVLPAAIQLRRSGASKGATVSFLVATPENGADSLAISYVLLGPFMTAFRLIAALFSAVAAGVMTEWLSSKQDHQPEALGSVARSTCCDDSCCETTPPTSRSDEKRNSLKGLRNAFTGLLDDIAVWLLIGVILAAMIRTIIPPTVMAEWGNGLLPMFMVLLISIPMYICATASTPIAASLLLAGVSPGTVLVFLLAGPATNLSSAGIVRKELGLRALFGYLAGVVAVTLLLGLSLDAVLPYTGLNLVANQGDARDLLPEWVSIAAAVVLGLLMFRSLGQAGVRLLQRGNPNRDDRVTQPGVDTPMDKLTHDNEATAIQKLK